MPTDLVLVPTELERALIGPVVAAQPGGSPRIELCGFGPVVAAARTARLVADHSPQRVLLIGIAGRFSDRLETGRAFLFERVACHGVGVGVGGGFIPAESLGWPQWPGDESGPTPPVGDALPCTSGRRPDLSRCGLLLSACAASATADDAATRLRLHPDAVAEDMEGFAVAAACRLAGVPLDIIRGISNTVGDRDRSGWQVAAACRAAADLAVALLGGHA